MRPEEHVIGFGCADGRGPVAGLIEVALAERREATYHDLALRAPVRWRWGRNPARLLWPFATAIKRGSSTEEVAPLPSLRFSGFLRGIYHQPAMWPTAMVITIKQPVEIIPNISSRVNRLTSHSLHYFCLYLGPRHSRGTSYRRAYRRGHSPGTLDRPFHPFRAYVLRICDGWRHSGLLTIVQRKVKVVHTRAT